MAAMKGQIFSVTLARRPTPPKKTRPASTAHTTPETAAGTLKAVCMACAMELDCTMLPMQPSAMMIAIEKKTASGRHFSPMPSVM